jgi:hypothetical protein
MAKLSAHGPEIGRIVYTTYTKAYFYDGKILKNSGFGWKLHGKVKAGFDPVTVFTDKKAHQESFLASHPALAAYRKELHSLAGMGKAWKLHATIQMMPDDPDGVWSETCDGYGDNVHADIDEVSKLCDLYHAAMREAQESKQAQPA